MAAFVADWSHTEGVITEVNILGIMGPRLLTVGEGNYKTEKMKYECFLQCWTGIRGINANSRSSIDTYRTIWKEKYRENI